jgi:hypothetical protein
MTWIWFGLASLRHFSTSKAISARNTVDDMDEIRDKRRNRGFGRRETDPTFRRDQRREKYDTRRSQTPQRFRDDRHRSASRNSPSRDRSRRGRRQGCEESLPSCEVEGHIKLTNDVGSSDTDRDVRTDAKCQSAEMGNHRSDGNARSLPTHVRLGNYSGDKCLETFLAKFENMSTYLNWSEKDRLFHLKASLDGPAGQVLWDMGSQSSVDDVIRLLRSRFGTDNQAERFRAELRARRRRKGDLVCYHYPRTYPGRTAKWTRFYTGPFKILKAVNDVNYVITKSLKSKPFIVHADKLKLYQSDIPAIWAGI